MTISLSRKDEQILEALTHDVRLLSVDQIARQFFGRGAAIDKFVRHRLSTLAAAGLLRVDSVLARPECRLTEPVISYSPGDDVPELGRAAYGLRKRWTELPRPIDVAMSTKEAQRMFGGSCGGYRIRASELTHDLHVGRLYLNYKYSPLGGELEWVGEGQLRRENLGRLFGGRVPDAVLRVPGKLSPELIVEFGGAYSAEKLGKIHAAFSHFRYVVW